MKFSGDARRNVERREQFRGPGVVEGQRRRVGTAHARKPQA